LYAECRVWPRASAPIPAEEFKRPRYNPASAAVGNESASTFARNERFSLSHKNQPFCFPGEADVDHEEQPASTPVVARAITIPASVWGRREG